MSERIALIHIGTHKTGTTALQVFFDANKEALRNVGVYVTESGRYDTTLGNHEVAWELLTSDMSPNFEKLVNELAARREQIAIVTSEDLSLLYARPRALDILKAGIELAGFSPRIVLYLRGQAPYAESMYCERIKHGHIRRISEYIATIERDGRYIPDGGAVQIEFAYSRLIDQFVRAFGGDNIVVRPYAGGSDMFRIYRDFLAVVTAFHPPFAASPLDLVAPDNRANASLSFGALLVAAHLHEALPFLDPPIPRELLETRTTLFQRDEHLRIIDAFASDNALLASQYGVTVADAGPADVAPADDPRWQIARIQRTIFDLLLEHALTKKAEG